MDNFPLKRGRGRPKGSKNQSKGGISPADPTKFFGMGLGSRLDTSKIGETKIGFMLCARFSFKNLAPDGSPVIILCHNAYPSHTTIPGEFRCPDLDSCLVRWSRAKEQREFQEKERK